MRASTQASFVSGGLLPFWGVCSSPWIVASAGTAPRAVTYLVVHESLIRDLLTCFGTCFPFSIFGFPTEEIRPGWETLLPTQDENIFADRWGLVHGFSMNISIILSPQL